MGRPRKPANKALPEHLYSERKGATTYYRYLHPHTKQMIRLGTDRAAALRAARLANSRLLSALSAEHLVARILTPVAETITINQAHKPHVILVCGVNGSGKTTTIAKLGQYYQRHGRSVAFAAGDTFRAAGSAQLGVWGERLGIPTQVGADGSDPGAVAYEAAAARRARGHDLLFVDTAGRLHTQHNLMEELKKVKRVIGKADPDEPKEVWLVMDAVTGQNGLQQAKRFHEAVGLTGVIVTKLDGTGKGGILLPIARELRLPIKFIGVGESAEDLQPYDAAAFVRALLDLPAEEPARA